MDVQTALQNMLKFYTDPILQIQALIKIIEQYGYNSELNQITTSQKEYDVVRFYALVLIGSVVPTAEFTSSTTTEQIASQLNMIFEAEFEYQSDMNVFEYLSDLQAECVGLIQSYGYGLPQLISYTSKTSQPACVIAQTLYQDGTRADEIVQRNNTQTIHPMFMPLTVEVLSE